MALNISLDVSRPHSLSLLGEVSKEDSAREALLKFNLRNQEEVFCNLFNRHISLPNICLKLP